MTLRAPLLVLALFALHQASGLNYMRLEDDIDLQVVGEVALRSFTPTCNYKDKYGSGHSMILPPNPDCHIKFSGVSEDDKAFILKLMNTLRSKVADGKEDRGISGPQPKAGNMKELKWNDELAAIAQAWASQCPKYPYHDKNENRKMCDHDNAPGQNYAAGAGGSVTTWNNRINSWYNEVSDFDSKQVKKLTMKAPEGKMIGHYTQVVWAKTEEIGCGMVLIPYIYKGYKLDYGHFVCNFYPRGNYLEEEVYDPEGSCANGPSAIYSSLCA